MGIVRFALGPMIVTGNLTDAWLYVLAPIVGAIITAHTGRLTQRRSPTACRSPVTCRIATSRSSSSRAAPARSAPKA
jgi:hypothetical protein